MKQEREAFLPDPLFSSLVGLGPSAIASRSLAEGLVPIEIKLTATPTLRHAEVLGKFRSLAGKAAAPEGILVCSVPERRALPGNNVAIPWHEFPQWLSERLG